MTEDKITQLEKRIETLEERHDALLETVLELNNAIRTQTENIKMLTNIVLKK